MKIIGCDFHPSYQQIAMVDTGTGELLEGRLEHEQGQARRFYEALRAEGAGGNGSDGQLAVVRADAGGTGPRVVDRRCGADPAVGGAATKDRPAGCAAHSGSAARWAISALVGSQREMRDVRQLLRHRQKLVEMRAQVKNQLQHLALNQGVRRKRRLWSREGREVLEHCG